MPKPSTEVAYWVPNLFPKQMEVFNCFKKFILVSGPRYSGKTLAAIFRIVRHLWETPGARVGVFSKTLKTAKDGGIWNDIVDIVMPECLGLTLDLDTGDETIIPRWTNPFGQPFEYLSKNSDGKFGPKSDGLTRTMMFKVRNYWGGESTLLLFSLDNESEAEQRLKSTRFSCLYFPELSNFKTNKVYHVGMNQLRMYHLREDQHLWIADTNPAEEGEDSWIYDLFYKQRTDPNHKYPSVRDSLHLIEIFLDDNPYLTPTRRAEIEQSHAHDQGEFERNVNGLWAKGHGKIGKVFADLFIPEIHVVAGSIDIVMETSRFYGGFDIGSVNSAAVILERRLVDGKSIWLVIDEVIILGEQISTQEFSIMVLEKIEALEKYYGKPIDFEKFWADDSALNQFRASAGTYDYLQVLLATNNRIELEGVYKAAGSIFQRIKILRQLLLENRFFVGENCPNVIEAIKEVQKGPRGFQKETKFGHACDALTYCLYAETIQELGEKSEGLRPHGRPEVISI